MAHQLSGKLDNRKGLHNERSSRNVSHSAAIYLAVVVGGIPKGTVVPTIDKIKDASATDPSFS